MSILKARVTRATCLGAVSYLAISLDFTGGAYAQQSNLPPVTVDAPNQPTPRRVQAPRRTANPATAARPVQPQAPPQRAEASLPPALAADKRYGARTEGKNTYTSAVVTAGGKDVQLIREIPQSISVVTRQRMDDQNATQLEDALRQTTGILLQQNDAGRSSIFSRGFEITDTLVDGLPAPVSSIMGTQPDLAIFDRIEVLKGPNGLFSGASAGNNAGPGATINLVRKRALDKFQGLASISYGSWQNKRTEVDLTGPLNKEGTVRGRLVGAFQDRNTFVDVNDNKVWVGYGTLEADLTDRTTLSVAAWRQERDITPFNGLPTFRQGTNPIFLTGAPRSTFIGASWNRFNNESTEYMAELNHELENGGHIRSSVRYVDRFVDYKYSQASTPVNFATGAFSQSLTAGRWWERHLSTDTHLSTPFQALGQTHNFTIGVDTRNHDLTQWSPTNTVVPGTYNFYNFNPYAVTQPADSLNTRTNQDPSQQGLYGQLRLKPVERATVILGGRVSNYHATTRNIVNNTVLSEVDISGRFTPYAGVVVDLTKSVSAYGSYTDLFVPQTERDVAGKTIAPRVGSQYETGLKGSWFNGALNASAAMFFITDNNRALAVVGSTPVVYENAGKVEVDGFELEVSGSLLPEWQVFAGYTNTHTRFVSGGTGEFRAFQPQHMFNLWTKYTFLDGRLRNFHVAGGARYASNFYAITPMDRLDEDGFVVADFQVGYKFTEHVSGTFSVTNLFDEVYYARLASASLFNFYGEPRAYNLKMSAKW